MNQMVRTKMSHPLRSGLVFAVFTMGGFYIAREKDEAVAGGFIGMSLAAIVNGSIDWILAQPPSV